MATLEERALDDRLPEVPIKFKATAVQIVLGHDADPEEQQPPRLIYDVRLDAENTLKLATGEAPQEVRFRVSTEPLTPDASVNPKGIGVLLYSERVSDVDLRIPPCVTANLRLPRPEFEELLAAARAGRCPVNISLEVRGLENAADAVSNLEWENTGTGSDMLPVKHATFTVPLVPQAGDDDSGGSPLSSRQMKVLFGRINSMARDVGTIKIFVQALLVWLVIVLIWQLLK